MTRTVPAGILAAIQSESFRLPMLVHMALADGSIITLTDWDVPLVVDLLGDGARTYSPNKMAGLSAFSAQINAPIDDSELILIIDDTPDNSPPDSPPDRDPIIANDIRRGAYDNAVVTRGYVLPTNLAAPWLYCVYDTGQASIEGLKITLELLGPEKRLEQPVGRKLTANCPWTFGDLDCGISARDPSRVRTGTVTSSAGRRTIVATGITVSNDFFGEGFITWLSGANAGDTRRVKTDNGTGTIVLHLSTFDDIANGDMFLAVVGCRKRLTEDCITKHDNVFHFGGFPFLAEENVTMTAPKG